MSPLGPRLRLSPPGDLDPACPNGRDSVRTRLAVPRPHSARMPHATTCPVSHGTNWGHPAVPWGCAGTPLLPPRAGPCPPLPPGHRLWGPCPPSGPPPWGQPAGFGARSGRAAASRGTATAPNTSPSPAGVTAPGQAAVPPPGPELSHALQGGNWVTLCPPGLAPASCPQIGGPGPPPCPVALGHGCGWGAPRSLQHPSPSWGAIALIRVISLAQLKSSSRLESVGAARGLLRRWRGGGSVWFGRWGKPGGSPA